MQTYDLVMIAVLLAGLIFGAWKGLAWQLASVASLVVSFFAAVRFSGTLAPYISDQEPLNRFVAMLLIYLTCGILIWFLFRMISGFIDRVKLKEFDRQVGAIVGLAKGGLLCIAITFFAISLTEDPYRESILKSRSGHYIGYVIDRAPLIMPDEIHEVIHPYLQELDEHLEHDHVDIDHHADDQSDDGDGDEHLEEEGQEDVVPIAIPAASGTAPR